MKRYRCSWCVSNPLMQAYHDQEWGKPVWKNDQLQFEFLVLEGAQAGLSWRTILNKRTEYYRAYQGFDVAIVARYGDIERKALLANPKIVRNRSKISSSIENARAFIAIQEEYSSFSSYLWNFVDGKPVVGHWRNEGEVPSETELSRRVSQDLRARRFSFVGPTIVYSHLQAVGVVNDHVTNCYIYKKLIKDSKRT